MPPATLKVWAWLSGGSEVVPNCPWVPTAGHAPAGAGTGLHGLSTRTQLKPLSKTDAV